MARKMRKNPIAYLEGADELNEALRAVGDRASGLLLQRAAEEGGKVIQEEAERRAPRETGNLQENVVDRMILRRQRVGRAQVDIGPTRDAWYGRFLELGTSKMEAQPWLRPAFEAKVKEATDAVANALRNALRGVLS
jgi:HK97 gp10 family phage protein